jgi:hypothetical protein
MPLLSQFRASAPATGRHPTHLGRLLIALVALGLLQMLVHVSADAPGEHADCPICKTLQDVLATVPQAAAIVLVTLLVLGPDRTVSAERRIISCFRGRAPPFSVFV